MGYNFEYPYVDPHRYNSDWLLHAFNEFQAKFKEFTQWNEIKWHDPLNWDINTNYEANTIVKDPTTNHVYLSKKPVSINTPITDTNYWLDIGILGIDQDTLDKVRKYIVNDFQGVSASRDYKFGELFWKDYKLYRVTTDTTAGTNWYPTVNCTEYPIYDWCNDNIDFIKNKLDIKIFNSSSDYNKHEIVWLDDKLVRFTSSYTHGTPIESHITEINIAGDLTTLFNLCDTITNALNTEITNRETADDNIRKVITSVIEPNSATTRIYYPGDLFWSPNERGTLYRVNEYMTVGTTWNSGTRTSAITIDRALSLKQNKMFINVKDYGAKGDGVTDDSTAFRRAYNDTPVHGTLYIPNGQYYLDTQEWLLRKPIRVIGSYTGYDVEDSSLYVTNAELKQTELLFNGVGGIHATCLGVTLEHLCVKHTDTVANPQFNFYIEASDMNVAKFGRHFTIDNCVAINDNNTKAIGFMINFSGLTRIKDCHAYGGVGGFLVGCGAGQNNTSVYMENCWVQNAVEYGYSLQKTYYSSLVSCACDGHSIHGYRLDKCWATSLVNCGQELAVIGFYVNDSHNCSISGMYVDYAGTEAPIKAYGSGLLVHDFRVVKGGAGTYTYELPFYGTCTINISNTNIQNVIRDEVTPTVIPNGGMASTRVFTNIT